MKTPRYEYQQFCQRHEGIIALSELPNRSLAAIANFGGPYGCGSVYKANIDGTGFEILRPSMVKLAQVRQRTLRWHPSQLPWVLSRPLVLHNNWKPMGELESLKGAFEQKFCNPLKTQLQAQSRTGNNIT